MDPTEQRVRDVVAQLSAAQGIDVEVVDCDPELADTALFVEAYGYSMEESANTIVVIGKTEPPVYAACVVLAHTRLDVNKVVKKRLGARKASFASADDTQALSGMTVGGVTPFALPGDLPLWIDSRVIDCDRVVLGGGSRACKVVGSPTLLTALPNAEVVVDLARVPD